MVLIYCIILILLEISTLLLSYKFKGFKFTLHTLLFRVIFIFLVTVYFCNKEPFVIALAMTSYFIINFFQDIFFHRYYYTKLNRWLLINYLIAFLIGLAMIVLKLYFYTIILNLIFSIIGVLVSAKSKKY